MPDVLTLRWPTLDEEDEFLRAHRATTPETPTFLHDYQEGLSLARYLERLAERERGVNLPPNYVPTTFRFAFKGSRIVGRVTIRHRLNDILERVGGHIGYIVLPEFRRQGCATEILRQAVRIAGDQLGLARVLVTCDEDNVASIRTIEKNGGTLEGVVSGPEGSAPKRRYWIDTGARER